MFYVNSFLICNKDLIIVYVNIILAVIGIIATFGLFLHRKAIKLQIRSLQASIFNDVSRRINELLDNEPWFDEEKEKSKIEMANWYIRLYNAFEQFAFFANRSHLDPEMKSYYDNLIEGYNERIKKEPYAIKEFKKNAFPDQYEEIKKLGIKLPF